jgi:hypothetical protein
MNIAIYESAIGLRHRLVKDGFATLDAAETYARENFKIICLERDADHENAADFFAANGSVYAIEPVKGA